MVALLCYRAVIVFTVSVILHQRVGASSRGLLSCPQIRPGHVGTCVNECKEDIDCRNSTQKCCTNGCGLTCQVAVRPCRVAFCEPCPFDDTGTFSDAFLSTVIKNDRDQTLTTKTKENFKSLQTADVLDLAKFTCKLAVVVASRLSRATSTDVQDWVDALKTRVDITQIKKTPTDVFGLFKKSLVLDMIQRMTSDQKACMCKYVLRTDAVTKAYLITIVCDQSEDKLCGVNGDTTASVCAFNAKLLSEYCVDATSPSQWTVDDLNEALNDDDRFKALCKRSETMIGQIPDDVIIQSVDSLSDKCQALKDMKCKRYLKKKAKKITTKAAYTKYKIKLTKLMCACGGTSRDIESLQLTDSEFMENFCGTAEKDPKEKIKIKKMVPDVSRLKRSDLTRLLPFVADDEKEVDKLNETTLLDVLPDIPPGSLKGRKAKNIFNVLKKSSKYSDFPSYTAADIANLGPNIMAVINQQSLSQIPSDSIGKAVESKTLKESEFLKGSDRIVVDKYKEYLGKQGVIQNGCLKPAQMLNLGKLMTSLKPDDFECMSGPEVKSLLGNSEFKGMLQEIGSKAEIRKSIAKKVKAESGGLDILMELETFKDDVGDVDDTKVTEIVTKIRNGEKVDIRCSKSKCKKFLDGLGKPKTWDRETLQNLEGSEVLSALSSEDIDDDSVDLILYLPKSGIREKTGKKFAEILEKFLNAASGDDIRYKNILKSYPKLLHMISKSVLQKLGVCMIEEMENDDLTSTPSYYLKDTFDYFFKCMGLESSSTINDTVLEAAGNLICAMQESQYKRLTKEALEEFNPQIARCPSQNLKEIKTRNKALRDTGSIPTASSAFTGDDLAILDADVSTQEISVIQNIPDDIFAELMEDLLGAASEREENSRKRTKHGFTVDNSDKEQSDINERENEFFKRAVNLVGSRSTSGRTRRRTPSLSCDDIRELGDAVRGITVDQVNIMQNDQFKECAGVLGGVINFRPDITLALANKAKVAYGQASTWTAKVIDLLGRITMGLGPSDLNVLQLTKVDIIRFGTYHGWSQNLLTALFSKFLTIEGKDIGAVTPSALGDIGNILCGATPNQIASITTGTYRQSAESIGQITNCSEIALTALANKARETFGNDITQWSTLTITQIGSVFGGLGSDIATLSDAQIEAIDEIHFRYIPSTSLAEFELAQLSSFSRVQAEASLRQSCDLPNDKRQKLLSVSGLTNDPCPEKTFTTVAQSSTTVPTTLPPSRPRQEDSKTTVPTTLPPSRPRQEDSTTETSQVSSTTTTPDKTSRGTTSERTSTIQTPETCPQRECPLECQRSARVCSRMFDSNNNLNDSSLSEIIRGSNVLKEQTKQKFDMLKPMLSEPKLTCDWMFVLIRLLTRIDLNEIQEIISLNIGRTVDIGKILRIHPDIMKMLKTSVLNSFIRRLSSNQDKACFCKMSFKLDCITRSTIKSGTCGELDCTEADLTSNLRCSVTKEVAIQVKKKCLDDKTVVTSLGGWTRNDYKSYLTDQEAAEVLAEKPNSLDQIDENALLTKKDIVKRTCADTTHNVKNQYKVAALRLGERTTDNTARDSLIDLAKVCGAKPNDLTFGSDTQKLSVFDDSQVEDPAEKLKIGKIFDQTYQMPQLDKANAVRFFPLFAENKQKIEQLSNDVFLDALSNITKKNMSMQAAQNVLKKFQSTRQSTSLTSITNDDVVSLGSAMKAFKKSEIKQIPDLAVAVPLFNGDLAKVEWTKAQSTEMYEKAMRHRSLSNTDLTSTHLENFGVSFVLNNLREVPSQALKTLLENDDVAQKYIEKLDNIDASTIRVFRKKLSSVSGGKDVLLKLGGGFVKSVTLDDSDREQVATDLQNGQRILKTFSKSEGKKVLKKLNKPDKLSSEDFENLEDSNLLGLVPTSDAKKIFETDLRKGLDYLKSLGKSKSIPSEKLIEECTKRMENEVVTANTGELSAIEDSIQYNTDILWRLSLDALRKMNNPETLITRMKDADISLIPSQKMREKFTFYLETKDLLSANEITANDCKDAGILICSATPSEYKMLSAEAYKECNSLYSKCPIRQTSTIEREKIQAEKSIPSNGAQYTEDTIATLGADLLTQPEDTIHAIQENVLKNSLQGILSNGKERETTRKRRKRKGFQNDVPSSEEKLNQKRRKVFDEKSIQTILSTRSSQSGRRRRSTSTLTCDEMRSIPTALSALTLEQIVAITTNDFGDCADILGQTDSFSTVQEEALALKAKETWGPTNGWNSSNIDNAGRILQGLSVNDLNTLTLSEDQIFTMGTYEDWEESKKKALFTNYLTLAGHSDASTITGSQLQSLSHIVCGAETSQLSQISPTNYGAAADSIGDLTSCSEQQLTELATLAKTYYSSDITAWTDATITELGIVIGGLPSTDIAQLTESHIDAIESGDIYYLPPTTLSYFSTTQFGYFSSAQAQAVSEGQRNALSPDQISALESAAGISFSTTHSNCRNLTMSWVLLLTVVVFALTEGTLI